MPSPPLQRLACAVFPDADGDRFCWSGYFNTQYYGNLENGEVAVLMKQTYGIPNDGTFSAFYGVMNR